MAQKETHNKGGGLEALAVKAADFAGSDPGFITALGSMLVWIIIGACVQFQKPWPYAMTVYISISTFLLVFLQRRNQKKQGAAIEAKLNGLVASRDKADNKDIAVEKEPHSSHNGLRKLIEGVSLKISSWAGSGKGFVTALCGIGLWALSGPFLAYGEVWQHGLSLFMGFINFVVIFSSRRAQRKEDYAMQNKLDELIKADEKADKSLIGLELKSERDVNEMRDSEARHRET